MHIFKALRPTQAIKNLLIFVPLFSIGNFTISEIFILIKIFFGFTLVVSSTYILNDILDVESDKLHPTKKHRAVASGIKSLNYWIVVFLIIFTTGNIFLYTINISALIITLIYVITTISYSIKLKYLKFFDLITISLLFTLRIFMGSVPLSIPLSEYIILFVFFTSLGLVAGKKYSILNNNLIQSSRIKTFLQNSYTSFQLLVTISIGFILSLSTYILWIISTKEPSVTRNQYYSLIISFLCLLVFKYYFFANTKMNKTEDIFEFIKTKKFVTLFIVLFLFSALYGLL